MSSLFPVTNGTDSSLANSMPSVDAIANVLAMPGDPAARAAALCRVLEEVIALSPAGETDRFGRPDHAETISLKTVVVAARAHRARMSGQFLH